MAIDLETKLKLYMLIVNRYKNFVSQQEQRSITEIRQRCSPYDDFIKKLNDRLLLQVNLNPQNYDYNKHFMQVIHRVLEYSRSIKNFEFLITFWMSHEEIDELKAAHPMDKSLLITALLRASNSPNVHIAVTKSKRHYVLFEYNNEKYMIVPESGSLLVGEDVTKIFNSDPLSYTFNDLFFQSYEE